MLRHAGAHTPPPVREETGAGEREKRDTVVEPLFLTGRAEPTHTLISRSEAAWHVFESGSAAGKGGWMYSNQSQIPIPHAPD